MVIKSGAVKVAFGEDLIVGKLIFFGPDSRVPSQLIVVLGGCNKRLITKFQVIGLLEFLRSAIKVFIKLV
jgi:hypothetical protein